MKNRKKYLTLACVIVILGGFVFWKIAPKETRNQVADSKDWLSYTNTQLGISFQYPKGVNITPGSWNTDTEGIRLFFPGEQYVLEIANPSEGEYGYTTELPSYPDKVIKAGQEPRTIRGYDNDSNDDVLYSVSLVPGAGTPETLKNMWVSEALIEKSLLNQSIVDIFDQIALSFKTIQ